MARVTVLGLVVVFMITPAFCQLACAFCGPSPEASATANPVPHSEDDCILNDGFERSSPGGDDGMVHIHFCPLHATFVNLTELETVRFEPTTEPLFEVGRRYRNTDLPSPFHPPAAA
jgi:hypothetical protein